MNFSPADQREILRLAAIDMNDRILAGVDIDDLNTLEISTAAQLLGITVTEAGKKLPVIEVGARTRRVRISAYKKFLAEREKSPKSTTPLPPPTRTGPGAPYTPPPATPRGITTR